MTIPPLINVFIALTKNTSVAGGFFVIELFASTRELANANGNAVIAILLAAATFYLLITIPLGVLAAQLERRWVVQR
jgi:glutamate transport system permease protein